MKKLPGLTTAQAHAKLQEFGPNELQDTHKTSAFQILLRQVKTNFIIYLLSLTAIVAFTLEKGITGYVILIVIAIVVVTGFIQEYKAEKAINALRSMITPVTRVVRNGKEQDVPSIDIVPGDVILLRTGERVPADCLVIEQSGLKANESVLTGEATEIGKTETQSTEEYGDDNVLFMGSFVVNGRCSCLVLHTGMNTKFGKIAGMISSAEKKLPLQDKVNSISKYMAGVGIIAASLPGLVLFLRADAITSAVVVDILIVVIALSVSSFPEGFPVVLTATLAAGVKRMAKQNAVVNRMSIIETLGETSVICTDKTGTLTKGEMTVKKLFVHNAQYAVSGVGYSAQGDVKKGDTKITGDEPILKALLEAAVLCNDTVIEPTGSDDTYAVKGSATEGALLVLAAKLGVFKENFTGSRREEIPFDSKRKMMSVLWQNDGKKRVLAKGAPEVLLNNCTRILTRSGVKRLSDLERRQILKENSSLTKEAYRSLAFAYKESSSQLLTENDMIFLGIVGMEDPPRSEVAEAITLCRQSGIKVKMITGDNKETAKAIAEQIGITGSVMTGEEMDKLSDAELTAEVGSIAIFARVKPEDKLRIVKALKENREIVTMTGDGVNDAPALKEAHIGVAMGINGTDVSRSVADITLKDDNFATIVSAIKEGRTIFNNIRKFVTYQLSCNLSDIYILFIGMIVAPMLGWYVPVISALKILFMNIVTDNMPAITLGFNPSSKDIMKDRPRKNAQILTPEFMDLIILNGISMGIIAFSVSYLSYNMLHLPPDTARTTILVSMIFMQIANAYNFRSFRYSVFTRNLFVNKWLVCASLLSIVATIGIVYLPLQSVFETTLLQPVSWCIALGAAIAITALFDFYKILNNKTKFFLQHVH